MPKIVFFDADGVLIVLREKFFSERLSKDYGIPVELIMPLFKNEYYKCVLGKMDLKEVLKSYINTWGWKGSVDELLKYWWEKESELNSSVLEIVDRLRLKGVKCYLTTDQEKYRANNIMKDMGLENHLEGAFFSCDLGVSKNSKEYWNKILKTLNVKNANEVYFYDDEEENIDAAKSVGINAVLFKGINDIKLA